MQRDDVLDAQAIHLALAKAGEAVDVQVLQRCGSTNSELLACAPSNVPVLLLADEQTQGRGRRGRRWHAPPGAALMLSLRYEFSGDAAPLGGLSLAVGVSIATTLRDLGAREIALKWPNDLLASMAMGGAKLGGILIETRSSPNRVAAVIGVGLNYTHVPSLAARLKRDIASLDQVIDALPGRNRLAASLAGGLVRTLRTFATTGFASFKPDWEALHAHQGKPMRIRTAHGKVISGIADGVAGDGALMLRTRMGIQNIHSGSVVRRPALRGAA